eukprot:sb/3470246/
MVTMNSLSLSFFLLVSNPLFYGISYAGLHSHHSLISLSPFTLLKRGGTQQEPTNQDSLFRSRDWLSANQGPVFLDSVGSWNTISQLLIYLSHPLSLISHLLFCVSNGRQLTELSLSLSFSFSWLRNRPIRTRYLGHVDWLSANQGPVFPDSVGSRNTMYFYLHTHYETIFKTRRNTKELEYHRSKMRGWNKEMNSLSLSLSHINTLTFQ